MTTLMAAAKVSGATPVDLNTKLLALTKTYIKQRAKTEGFSAVGVTVQAGNNLPISIHLGTTEVNGTQRVTADNIGEIGSITKSMLSCILLQLESDPSYNFSINDPIGKYFPEYPEQWRNIPIIDLMNMTSGIEDYYFTGAWNQYLMNPSHTWMPPELLYRLTNTPLLFVPGKGWSYSNSNYVILGELIERLTGQSVGEEIQQRIINPLHLTHTYYLPNLYEPNIQHILTHGYDTNVSNNIPPGTDTTYYSASFWNSAGGIYSTSDDVATYVKALYAPKNNIFLNSTEYKKLTTTFFSETNGQPITINQQNQFGYGLGILGEYTTDGTVYCYEGWTVNGRAVYFYLPAKNITAVVTLNSATNPDDDGIWTFAWSLYNTVLNTNV